VAIYSYRLTRFFCLHIPFSCANRIIDRKLLAI
jgi:hypothetical protein